MEAHLTQGTDEWKEFRKTKITSTDSSIILGVNKFKTPYDLLLQKLGLTPEEPMNERMQRGIDLEPKARECFYQMTGHFTMPICIVSKEHDFMLSSIDGLSLDGKVLLEIKCTNKTNHNMAKKGKIPSMYYPQLQHHLSVTGLPMCYYFSYDGEEGIIVEVPRDDGYIKHLVEAEKEFFTALTSFVDNKDISKYYNPQPG